MYGSGQEFVKIGAGRPGCPSGTTWLPSAALVAVHSWGGCRLVQESRAIGEEREGLGDAGFRNSTVEARLLKLKITGSGEGSAL